MLSVTSTVGRGGSAFSGAAAPSAGCSPHFSELSKAQPPEPVIELGAVVPIPDGGFGEINGRVRADGGKVERQKLANKTIDETTVQNDRDTQLKNSMHNQILIYVIANISRINIQLKFQLKKSSNCVMK